MQHEPSCSYDIGVHLWGMDVHPKDVPKYIIGYYIAESVRLGWWRTSKDYRQHLLDFPPKSEFGEDHA